MSTCVAGTGCVTAPVHSHEPMSPCTHASMQQFSHAPMHCRYWLPYYIKSTPIEGRWLSSKEAGDLSVLFDIGGVAGGQGGWARHMLTSCNCVLPMKRHRSTDLNKSLPFLPQHVWRGHACAYSSTAQLTTAQLPTAHRRHHGRAPVRQEWGKCSCEHQFHALLGAHPVDIPPLWQHVSQLACAAVQRHVSGLNALSDKTAC